MSEENRVRLTPEQIDEIRKLPVRSAQVGGTPVRGYFRPDEDGEGGLLYIVNDHWDIVRVVRRIRKPEEDSGPGEKKQRGRSGRILLAAALLLAAAAAAAALFLPGLLARRSGPAATPFPVPAATAVPVPSSTPAPSPAPSPTAEPEEILVRAAADLHKGDRMTEASAEPVPVSADRYSELIRTGAVPVRWEYLDTVTEMYVNRFVPAGQYLSVSYFSTLDPVPSNPWSVLPGGYVTAEIPVSDLVPGDIPYYGAKGTLTLWREADSMTTPVPSPEPPPSNETPDPAELYETPAPAAAPAPVDGLSHETSVSRSHLVDSYTVRDVVVTDLLNAEGQSIYGHYAKLIDMPELYRRAEFGELCADPAYLRAVTPVRLAVRLSAEQAAVLGRLDLYTVSLDLTADAADGDAEATIANGTMLLQRMVSEIRALLPEEEP